MTRVLFKRVRTGIVAAVVLTVGMAGAARAQFLTVNAPGTAAPGQTIEFTVDATTEGADVVSLDVTVGYPASSPVDVGAPNRPDCVANPALNKGGSSFRYRPTGCTVGEDCNAVKAGIFDTGAAKNDPIPDGLVFTCKLTVPEDAATGTTIALTVDQALATSSTNVNTDVTAASQGTDVSVEEAQPTDTPETEPTDTPVVEPTDTPVVEPTDTPVVEPTDTPVVEPTDTPEAPTATPTQEEATPTPVPDDEVVIEVDSVIAEAGQTVPVDVTLIAGSQLTCERFIDGQTEEYECSAVAGTANDIKFDVGAEIGANQLNQPDCTVNPAINKGGTGFGFQPAGCAPGDTCTGIRAFVLALTDVSPIPTGSVLYTCNVNVADGANNAFPLECVMPGASDPAGGAVQNVSCEDGCVDVPEIVIATVGAGASVTTDTEENGTTELDPTETTLTTPNSGLVSIRERGRCTPEEAPAGLELIGLNVRTSAPAGSPAAPVEIRFSLDESIVDVNEDTVVLLKDGERVDECLSNGVADPDPCVDATDSSDLEAVVLAADANALWQFAVELPPTPTATFTVVPTATNTPVGPTVTPGAPTSTPTQPAGGGGGDEDDGCQIVAPADSQLGWLLLAPAALLLWRRRRSA